MGAPEDEPDSMPRLAIFFPKDVSSQGSSEDCWRISHHTYPTHISHHTYPTHIHHTTHIPHISIQNVSHQYVSHQYVSVQHVSHQYISMQCVSIQNVCISRFCNTYPTNTYPFNTYPTNTYPCYAYPFNAYPFKRCASAGIASVSHQYISHQYVSSTRIPPVRIHSMRIHSKVTLVASDPRFVTTNPGSTKKKWMQSIFSDLCCCCGHCLFNHETWSSLIFAAVVVTVLSIMQPDHLWSLLLLWTQSFSSWNMIIFDLCCFCGRYLFNHETWSSLIFADMTDLEHSFLFLSLNMKKCSTEHGLGQHMYRYKILNPNMEIQRVAPPRTASRTKNGPGPNLFFLTFVRHQGFEFMGSRGFPNWKCWKYAIKPSPLVASQTCHLQKTERYHKDIMFLK